MHIVNVSNFNNNSGLYALGLAVKLAIEANAGHATTHSQIPIFVQQIRAADLAEAQNPTEVQQQLAASLRLQMAAALNHDFEFKRKKLDSFTQLCLSSNAVPLDASMAAFITSNAKFISDLNVSFKNIESYQKHTNAFNSVAISEAQVKAFEAKLVACMKSGVCLEEAFLISCSAELAATNVNELYKFCKLFALAYGNIEQTTPNKQEIMRVVNKWFAARASAIYSAADESSQYKQLFLLGLCATLVGHATEPLYNAKEIYVKYILHKSWDDIYRNYVMHIGNRNSTFSAAELCCLASYWNVQLTVQENDTIISNVVLNPVLTITIANESENRWSVLADDSLLEPVSQEQDDKFKTLILLNELVKEIFTTNSSSLAPVKNFKTIRNDCITLKNVIGELLLKPKDPLNSFTISKTVEDNTVEKKQSIEMQNNAVLWSFRHRNPVFSTAMSTNLVGGFAAATLLESGAAVAGMYGVEEGIVFARAVQAGRAAGTTFEAARLGAAVARAATNPFMLGSVAVVETYMLSRRKLNEFSGSIRQALELYKEAVTEHNKEKLQQVDEMLRAEIGKGNNSRWPHTRLAIWLQSSNDQCALIYYILGEIAKQFSNEDSKVMFEKAYYYAKEAKLKWLSLFGLTRELIIKKQQPDAIANESIEQELNTNVHKNIEILNAQNNEMVGNSFNDVMNTLSYVLGVVCLQKTSEALVHIEQILNNNDINIIKHLKPHGKICEIIFAFIQGVCLELKAIEIKKAVTASVHPIEADIYLMCEAYRISMQKFTDCVAIILDAEQHGAWGASDTLKVVLIEEMRNYCRRFLENSYKENLIQDDVANLVAKYRLDDKSVSAEDDNNRLKEQMMAKRNSRKKLTV